MKTIFSRRRLLQAAAVTAGSVAGSRLWSGSRAAAASTEKSAVVLVFLDGGYNALFSSADSFLGAATFGVAPGNVRALGNGLAVDATTYGTLDQQVLDHTAAI